MGTSTSALLGVFLGVVCALPLALLQRRAAHGEARMGAGLAAVAGSFLVMQCALVVVWLAEPPMAAPFGLPMVFSFLATVVISATVH